MDKDVITPQQRTAPEGGNELAGQDWAGVAKKGIGSMTPADKGWVLAVVIMFLGMTGINYFSTSRQIEGLGIYLNNAHKLREIVEQNRAQELRRAQETIKTMADAISRQSERASRAKRETALIEQTQSKLDE